MIQKFVVASLLAASVICSCRQKPSLVTESDSSSPAKPAVKTDYQIIREGAHCGELNIDPDLNWYGLFETDNARLDELKIVEIELILRSSLSEEQIADVFGEDNIYADYLIKTNSERPSVFLIGSKLPMEEYEVKCTGLYETGNSGFLYPEQKESVFIPGCDELLITGRENVFISDTSACTVSRSYELELSSYNRETDVRISQNLMNDIPFTGYPASQHAGHQSPRIVWCGDLDNDHIFDLLIYSDQMRESGDNMGSLILFLSSEAEEGKVVRKAAEWYFKVSCEG